MIRPNHQTIIGLRFFEDLFKNSKARDSENKPLMVFHGTPYRFKKFDKTLIGSQTDKGMYGQGFYFSTSKLEASKYGKYVMAHYLIMNKPFELDAYESLPGKMKELGLIHEGNGEINHFGKLTATSKKMTDILKENGYDGVIKQDLYGAHEYIAFEASQIMPISMPNPKQKQEIALSR
ncbi:hypothetical protein RYA05_06030 [Pseudomonas syringae pv. actinidiae]|nr:hypothetical protein [Pseudomonas syringae pv. actinidiae]